MKDAGLTTPQGAGSAQVYGLDGIVEYDGTTVFLARFGALWLVTAAGCVPAGAEEPMQCQVKGG